MSISNSTLQAILRLQPWFHPQFPLIVDAKTLRLLPNPTYSLPKYKKQRRAHNKLVLGFFVKSLIILYWSLQGLGANGNQEGKSKYELATLLCPLFHTTVSLVAMIHFAKELMVQQHMAEFVWLFSERVKLIPVPELRNRFVEFALFLLVCMFILFAVIGCALPVIESSFVLTFPFTFHYFPVLSWILVGISSMAYSLETLVGAMSLVYIFLIFINFGDGLATYTRRIYEANSRFLRRLRFVGCHRRFVIARLLIAGACRVTSAFFLTLVGLGMTLGATISFIVVDGYRFLPLYQVIAAVPLVFVVVFFNFVLIHLAAIPYNNGRGFVLYWKRHLVRRVERKELKACPKIGYSVGPFRNVREEIAVMNLRIMMDVLFNLLLLKK